MKVRLPVPDQTILSRRGKTLNLKLSLHQSPQISLHLIVDSTGLSIHGEGPVLVGINAEEVGGSSISWLIETGLFTADVA